MNIKQEDIIMVKNNRPTVNGVPIPGIGTRNWFTSIFIIVMFSIIWYVLIGGDDENSLHTSALSWAFFSSIAVLFAHLFAANVSEYIVGKEWLGKDGKHNNANL